MKSPMQQALGADWERLPPALRAHYRCGTTIDTGHLDIEYPRLMQPLPRLMQPLMSVLYAVGALVNRRGRNVPTVVGKTCRRRAAVLAAEDCLP